jgi:hypothetical protein
MENGTEPNGLKRGDAEARRKICSEVGLEGLLHPLGLSFILYTDEANHIKP